MRGLILGIAWVGMLAAIPLASAEQPPSEREQAVTSELAEVKQTLQALTLQVDTLQRELTRTVTSLEQADPHRLYDAAYNVSDLVVEWRGDFATSWDPNRLVRYITTHIAPQQWEETDGAGKIRIYHANRSLVITQTAEVHQELHQWFKQLREARAALIEIAGGIDAPSVQ